MAGDWPQYARPMTRVIGGDGTSSATFTVPAGVVVTVESVVATIDTAGAASTGRLVIADDAGAVIVEKRQTSPIPANDLDRATWALRLAGDDGGTAVPLTRAVRVLRPTGTLQTTLNNTLTACTFTNVSYQFGSWVNLGISNTDVTVPDDGFYEVQGSVRWGVGAAASTRRSIWISLNGSLEVGQEYGSIPLALTDQSVVLCRRLFAGDVLRLVVLQGSGGNLTLGLSSLAAQRVGTLVQ